MNDLTYTHEAAVDRADVAEFAGRVYGWVAAGLFLSAFTAYAVNSNTAWLTSAQNNFLLWALLPFAPLLLLSFGAARLSGPVSTIVYCAFCALEGIALGVIVSYYTSESVTLAFVTTAGLFTAMAVVGTVTKRDLTSLGGLLFAGLLGIITYAGVAIFLGLTAYDAQRVKLQAQSGNTSQGAAMMCAVGLYLDALNLFLFLLRIFGRN